MIRIFSCPKKFVGETRDLQIRAIRSWQKIGHDIVLTGPSADIETVPSSLNLETRITGTPDPGSPPEFRTLIGAVSEDIPLLLWYTHTDILFPTEIGDFRYKNDRWFLGQTKLPERFLLTGSRWETKEGTSYQGDFSISSFRQFCMEGDAILHDVVAMDFFIFPGDLFEDLPPLHLGRAAFDNALIAFCLRKNIPVIDLSREWPAIHQFHGYGHKSGGKKEVYYGDEAMENRRVHDIDYSAPTSLDADFYLENGDLVKSPWRCGFWRRLELVIRYRWGLKRFSYLFRAIQRIFRLHEITSQREMRITETVIFGREVKSDNTTP